MVYKTIMYYTDSAFQERWISEMKAQMPQFVSTIDELLAYTKRVDIDNNADLWKTFVHFYFRK